MQDEHGVDGSSSSSAAIASRSSATRRAHAEVDRVAQAVGAGQRRGQPRARRLAGRRELEAARRARVGRHHAEAARVRHHADPAPARQRLALEQLGGVEQRLRGLDAQHAGLAEERIGRRVVERAPAAALDGEDRLAPRHAPGDLREAPRVAEGLHVEGDDRRALVVGPVLEQVVGRHVGAVAQRDEGRDAQAARGGVARAAPGRARPTATTAPARPGRTPTRPMSACRLDARLGVDDAQRVGPDQPQPVGADGLEQRLLARAALGLVAVGEARRDDEQRPHPAARRLAHDAEHLGGRHRHDRELRRLGEVAQRARRARRGDDAARRDAPGTATPAKPPATMARKIAPPTLSSRSEAPTTATERGREQRAQRGDGGDVRAVGAALLEARGRAQVEREVDLAEVGLRGGCRSPRPRRRRASRGCRPSPRRRSA